ncbi:MAG: NAD(P)-dependent oxidoreductase [bacterium]
MVHYVAANLPARFVVHPAGDEAAVDALMGECDVILDASMHVRFPADRLARGRRLRLFVTATTGADHVDGVTLARRGVPLLTLQGQREVLREVTAAAEHSWLLLLACARGLRGAVDDVLGGTWDRQRHPGLMLKGRTLGLVGCGRIGLWMARYAGAFGMRCWGYDPYVDPWPKEIERRDLAAMLQEADVVSIHVPLNDETRRMIGPREVGLLKRGVILINTSRGEVVDDGALLAALRSGQVAAAGVDVLTGEPQVADHPLVQYARSHPNVIITPHIGGFSPDAVRHVLAYSCQRITDFFTP